MATVEDVAFRRMDERLATFLSHRLGQSNSIQITHQEIAAELAFLGQLSRVGRRDDNAVLFGADDIAAVWAGAGVNQLSSQRMPSLVPDDGRLPAYSKLGRSMGHNRHPFGQ